MERVYYDIADNFVKDLEKKLNKSIEINEKENKIKIENEIIKYEEKDIGVRSFSVPYFVENQTIINYDGNDKELTNKIEDICTAYTDIEIEAIEETMPILKKYSEERKKNLEGVAIIWRDHFLEENVGLLTSMVRMGVKPEDVLAIDKGDSTKHRQEITATFKKLGYQVDVLDNTAVANDILIEDGKRLIREFIAIDRFDEIIKLAILNHNRADIEKGLTERENLHARIIRDADKLDIFYVLVTGDKKAIWESSDLSNDEISDEIYREFMEDRVIDYKKVQTSAEILVTHFAYVYDFNFKQSLEIIKEHNYLDKLYCRFNFNNEDTREKIQEIYEVAKKYLEEKG